MNRRGFLTSSLAMSALALRDTPAQTLAHTVAKPREFYLLRKYQLRSGPQIKLADTYFEQALIPAANRLGITPVGAFRLTYGSETPATYILLPSTDAELLATLDLKLARDTAFMAAAALFWNAPAVSPAFERVESSLHIAFEGWPKLILPASTATNAKRIFQLRTYESPTMQDHVRKVEMFHSGEFDYFARAGCTQVFYGDTLIGPRLPSLTYMLTFTDLTELTTNWAKFSSDPDWRKLSANPRFGFEATVSNISNLVLTPTTYSQI
jgi:NIPSNAP